MSHFSMKPWWAALVVAIVLGTEFACAGEVTVIGSLWTDQPPQIMAESQSVPAMTTVERGPIDGQFPDVPSLEEPGTAYSSKTASLDEFFPNGYFWEGNHCRKWAIDYRFRCFTSSNTAYEFGTPELPPVGWDPMSRLDFALNSCWHGLRVGIEDPCWGAQFEWMMPQNGIQGELADYDWNPPNPDGSYTDLGFAKERWSGDWGMMIDLGAQFQLTQRTFRLPIEVWPIAGFRWQRFHIKAFDLYQVKYENQWIDPPYTTTGSVIDFNQQYYTGYLGSQFRTRIRAALITFQADWGYSWAYNVDHHIAREGMRYTMDQTQGDCWHLGVNAEVPLSEYVSIGFQYDHLVISTIGTHHHSNLPRGEDETWTNGVRVGSNQNWVTGFVRFRF